VWSCTLHWLLDCSWHVWIKICNSRLWLMMTLKILDLNFFIVMLGEGYIVAFIDVLKIYQIYHTWTHSFHHSPLSLPSLIPGIVSTGTIFPLTYMCTQYLDYVHPCPFSTSSAPPTDTNTP
jgi:hypothetical protein